jgi:formyl-CoA transferase/CoA:oxalate CoA-transferase
MIAVGNDSLWRKFARATGLAAFAEDPRFATNRDRVGNRESLIELIDERLKTRPTAEWISVLEAEGIPVGPINTVADVMNDPHVRAREMVVELEHPSAGTIRMTGIPVKFSETPGAVETPPPLLGEHTGEVLRGLGYSQAEIGALREKGVV